MKALTRYHVLLLVILLLAFCLRFYKLGAIPIGLNQDETAIGYNAYSILQTGRDEYGTPHPLYFRSFDDYKLPVYIYSTALMVKLFGLTPFAVRFTSALFGTLSILGMYLLVRDTSKKIPLALIAAFLLAINPWNMFFSRAGFEVNVAVSLLIWAAWFFIKAFDTERNSWFLFLSVITFGISLYTYNVTRLFAPLLFIMFVIFYRRKVLVLPRYFLIIIGLLGVSILIPFLITFQSGSGFNTQTNTLLIGDTFRATTDEFRSYLAPLPPFVGKLLFNNVFLILWQYIKNVFDFFTIPFFFINGASHPINGVENFGMFHLIELPFILFGLYEGIRRKTAFLYPFYAWIGIVVLVGSIIVETPHPTRHYLITVPFIIFSAYGLYSLWEKRRLIRLQWLRNAVIGMTICLFSYSILFFLATYFYRFPILYAATWRADDKEIVRYIQNHQKVYDTIVFDKAAAFSYTSFLFYTQYPPATYQKNAVYAKDGLLNTLAKIGKYEFRPIDISQDMPSDKRILFVSDSDHYPKGKGVLKTFYYPTRPVVNIVNGKIEAYPYDPPGYVLVENRYK